MKNILFILMLFTATSITAQISDNELNTSYDNSKDKVYAIDNCFQYLKTTINEGTTKLTGHFNFDLYKVVEEENGNKKKYYWWNGKFFSVYDSKMKKQFFFSGDYKNASQKLYEFYSNKAELYKNKFDNYLISPIIKVSQNDKLHKQSDNYFSQEYIGRYDKTKFNNFKCIIIETSNYSVTSYSISYAGNGTDGEYKVPGCKITEKVKEIIENYNQLYLSVRLKDKNTGSSIKLPNIKLNK
ncbi:MAG: hypothetical protein K8R54_09380 [Bacteroidales bacterium]|nr:hypothetical protein [Bacteroidales bacterium]